LGKIVASGTQVQRDVEQCRALATSIANLARSLGSPAAVQTSSMTDTISEVVEQSTTGQPGSWLSELNTAQDFTYRVPREIMKFVLANLLRSTIKATLSYPKIDLHPGSEHNEVRIVTPSGRVPVSLDDDRSLRTVRCALWAFGGELLASTDEDLGTSTLTVCLPKA
jgi:two-component system probable response regulator PhcQ